MTTGYLSLGSNMGNRLNHLAGAVRLLPAVTAVSGVYETAPQGKTDQPDFLNIAVQVRTELDPVAFFRRCQEVEQALGRVRKERWGPRSIDIDLVLWGAERLDLPDLTVPHPRLAERAFVLIPVLELNRDAQLPDGTPLSSLLKALPAQGVRLFLPSQAFLSMVGGVQ